jgi:hypothetical protein
MARTSSWPRRSDLSAVGHLRLQRSSENTNIDSVFLCARPQSFANGHNQLFGVDAMLRWALRRHLSLLRGTQ